MINEMINLENIIFNEADSAEKIINFPYGIVGFEACRNFMLYKIKNERLRGLISLESLDMDYLRFISIPTSYKTITDLDLIKGKDLDELLDITGIEKENLLLLFLVTIQENDKILFNHRAPIVIDISTKIGMQVVFDDSYPLSEDVKNIANKK